MTTIKCRKCGKVYPFNEKICPDCGYDIRKDETLSPRDRVALGLKSDSALFEELGKENMERWKTQTREERLQDAWENRNKFEIRPDQGGLPRVNIRLSSRLKFHHRHFSLFSSTPHDIRDVLPSGDESLRLLILQSQD